MIFGSNNLINRLNWVEKTLKAIPKNKTNRTIKNTNIPMTVENTRLIKFIIYNCFDA